jgi:hypothetical protein
VTEKAIVYINDNDCCVAYGTVLVGFGDTITDDLANIGNECCELGFPNSELVGLLLFEGGLYSGDFLVERETEDPLDNLERRGTYRRLTPDEAVRFANGEDVL